MKHISVAVIALGVLASAGFMVFLAVAAWRWVIVPVVEWMTGFSMVYDAMSVV